ncbi:glycine receptor subunit alpha-2-like [Uloborus diversus]|uniref:glycine receptor subunit alpha-2-like n=1 Tax=Uloborus diversus TaxID=327109 RepID=UPI002409B643|nr:glycine receptor subunit alpha-2-like [Uloborus diversus]
MKVTCSMTFYSYPMDTQNCYLSIASLANDNSKVEFKWLHEREEGNSGIPDLARANFAPLKYYVANVNPGKRVHLWPSGDFTVLYVNFTFVRHISSHIFNVFIPSGMVVILSFLTFWLNVRSVPARVALGLTSLLTLSTQASQARNHLPPINYLTALDVWLFSCIMLVFLSLLEYATVYHLHNEKILKKKRSADQKNQWADKRSALPPVSGATSVTHNEKERITPKKSLRPTNNTPSDTDAEEDTQFLDKSCRSDFRRGKWRTWKRPLLYLGQ